MDKSLNALCDALKKVIVQLKPQHHPISFLLLIGKNGQGKSTLLRQSHFEQVILHADGAYLYYNKQGIVLSLGEAWLNKSKHLLQYTLKCINRCHRIVKITGIIACVDIDELLTTEQHEIKALCRTHTQLLERFGRGLGYSVASALLFTKIDALAGFCDFFQYEHEHDLQKPLGFSLHDTIRSGQAVEVFKKQFDQLIEALGQQIIQKIHPVRSSVKRTLIREFPLQLATLRTTILLLISTLPHSVIRLESIYFTSGEQGGVSVDRLNKKIQHEYALTIRDEFPQSQNYRAYFIEGALNAFQAQTIAHPPSITKTQQWVLGALATTAFLSFIWIGQQYFKKSHLLDEASKELIAYDSVTHQKSQKNLATFYLAKASNTLEKISSNSVTLPSIHALKLELRMHTKQQLSEEVIPSLLHEMEQAITDANGSQVDRYAALKIYLMLGDKAHFSEKDVTAWFRQHWKQDPNQAGVNKKLALLTQVLQHSASKIQINQQVVRDTRNYLNALPASYLYYSLAKAYFPKNNLPVMLDGFSIANKQIPIYLTKPGFHDLITELPQLVKKLQTDNWVLERQDLYELPLLLQQAYCYEYVIWWQNFMKNTNPMHVKDYGQAHQLMQTLRNANSINTLLELIQQQTSPESGTEGTLFNREIASKFTELSLMSHSAVRHLTQTINELEKFLNTLSIVNDQGKTAFNLTKSRFQGDSLANPLSTLFNDAAQLPEPVATWAKQIAEDTWFTLINDSRHYLNLQWQQLVFNDYQKAIANRYPFDPSQTDEIALSDFNQFFSPHGILNRFTEAYLKPFIDTSNPQWALKEANHYVLPISTDMINELIRANVITNMFFPEQSDTCQIDFSLQKMSLDPIVSSLKLSIGNIKLSDTQTSDSVTEFHWPEANALLVLNSIEGKHYELEELGSWAFFKILQKVNVLVDEQDSANLQILFEINGNSGRYLLKTQNQVNPFIPGILNEFNLPDAIV